VTRLAGPGDAIVAGDDLYGGTYRLLSRIGETHGIEVRYVDTTDLDAVARSLDERARLLLLETPTNPLLKVTDLRAAARLAHDNGTLLAVDNSIMSPYFQKPLELGADIVVESATKALSGHSDMTGGVVAVKDPELAERLYWVQNAEGAGLAPFESWLLLRSVKTLAVRLDRQVANAERVARFLRERPEVEAVHWPGFEDHPGHAIHAAQARGASVVISFETDDYDTARRIVEATEVFKISVSFGGVGSVISLPCRLSHASIPPEVRRARAIPEGLVRLSVGIEAAEDLVADLEAAFEVARTGRTRSSTREVTA
jgi:cystathionine beta-lyase